MSQQTNNVAELQGNETTGKNKFIKLQEFVNNFYGNPENFAVKLQSLYFHFVNVMLDNEAYLLAGYDNELFALQTVIECLQYTPEDDEETNKNQ